MSKLIEGMKSVSDFLNDALTAVKGKDFVTALADVAPWWAESLGKAASESLPLVGFVLKYAKILVAENDPQRQGYTACTLAYNRAVEQAFRARNQELKPTSAARELNKLAEDRMPKDIDMQGFTFDESALSHAFVIESDSVFRDFAAAIGIDTKVTNKLINTIHQRFLANLRLLLVHPETRETFFAFAKFLEFNIKDYKARKALEDHKQYQWWLFNEAPVFGQEPFALTHIYADIHCGVLKWSDIRGPERKRREKQSEDNTANTKPRNPFSEVESQRVDLLDMVLNYIADDDFNEPIVIQGVAGAGKSSFTLRLTSELIDAGFSPIRVQLRDLDVDRGLLETLPNAIRFGEKLFKPYEFDPQFDHNWFASLPQSNEYIEFGSKDTRVSPYVFIFDGWDEISTGATQGFKDDIDRVLTEIRRHFIDYRGNRPPIRVIVTGRPTVDVTKTRLLQDKTPIFTIRPLNPSQLDNFIDQVLEARQSHLVEPNEVQETSAHKPRETQVEINKKWFVNVVESYRKGFEAMKKEHEKGNVTAQLMGSMAVLGMPLLAHLALRLMLNLKSFKQLQALIETPTTLYRALVDMTYEKGAKSDTTKIDVDHRYRIIGDDLRVLLWNTAEAIMATGSEEISREELKLRLRWDDDKLARIVSDTTEDNVLSGLIIGFFFKEGTDEQGCEFLHKSFREYLFAEGVVELLKRYGRDKRVSNKLKERAVYWEDFEDEDSLPHESTRDPRYDFIHRLATAFSTRWPSPEVKEHLRELITWEVGRAGKKRSKIWPGLPTESITVEQWNFVRDGLADAWDWWAEGVLLRPKPKLSRDFGTPGFTQPYIVKLTELCSPRDPGAWKGKTLPDVVRTTTIDSRLGEAFYHLTAVTHAELFMSALESFSEKQINVYELDFEQRRRYQRKADVDDTVLVRFAPSGEYPSYFQNFCARINAAGWRPEGQFPSSTFGQFLFLNDVYLRLVDLSGADLSGADLRNANMDGARFAGTRFRAANVTGAKLDWMHFDFGSDLINVVGLPK